MLTRVHLQTLKRCSLQITLLPGKAAIAWGGQAKGWKMSDNQRVTVHEPAHDVEQDQEYLVPCSETCATLDGAQQSNADEQQSIMDLQPTSGNQGSDPGEPETQATPSKRAKSAGSAEGADAASTPPLTTASNIWTFGHAVGGNVPRTQFVYPMTDLGNAQMFHRLFGKLVRWDCERGQWIVWNGKRWLTGMLARTMTMRLIKKQVTALYLQAQSNHSLRTRNNEAVTPVEALDWAKKTSSKGRQQAMLELVRDLPGVRVSKAELDPNPHLLGVANGVLNLLSAKLVENRPDLLITRYANAAFQPKATAPNFLRFIYQVCLGRKALVDFLQEILGYILSGLINEQFFFILVGTGANGKSTLVELFLYLLGEYGLGMPSHSFLKSNSRAIRNDIARLPGVRFAPCAEVNTGTSLDESLVKRATGGDVISARFIGKELFDFHPSAKFFLSVNTLPRVTGADNGIYRRLVVIPFDGDFEATMDRNLTETLKTEIDGVLAWAVEGFQRWHARGHLVKPECVIEACQAYRAEMDTVQSFLDECCHLEPKGLTQLRVLYGAFEKWAKSSSVEPVKIHDFGAFMRQKGFTQKHSGGRFWNGVTLKAVSVTAGSPGVFGPAAAETESATLPQ